MKKLNFTMSELLHSDEAIKHGINNIPNDKVILDNMLTLIIECLQPLRDYIGKPMIITSGYRCKTLNDLPIIKGAKNSHHLLGCAVDFTVSGLTVKQIIEKVKSSGIDYCQVINEHNLWCHISFIKGQNRKEELYIP